MVVDFSPVADKYIPSDLFKHDVPFESKHVFGVDFDVELNPIKKMAVMVLGDHRAVFTDMVSANEADGVAGREHGGVPGRRNEAVQNQLLGMQLGLLSLSL